MKTNGSTPIRTVREQIADQLRNEILALVIEPDEPLREAGLAERFGTSRGPIRDVLLQLTQEGALTYKPNVGVRVSEPPDGEVRTLLMGLRRQIEDHALPVFVESLTDEHRAGLREILADMKTGCEQEDLGKIAGADLALHRYIVREGASPEVEAVWNSIAMRIRLQYSRLDTHAGIYKEHAAIVDAICDQDLDAARAALGSNLI